MEGALRHMTSEQDVTEFRLQDHKTALDRALRIVAMYGNHWAECRYLASSPRPCSCGFVGERRELAAAVRAARQ